LFLPAISGAGGLPFAFGKLVYDHRPVQGFISDSVRQSGHAGSLEYHGAFDRSSVATQCPPGSLAEHAMERYSGFFSCRGQPVVFRAWHPPWPQIRLQVTLEQRSLMENQFPWFKNAKFTAANFTPGFDEVWLGRAHRLKAASVPQVRHRHG